MLFRLHVVSQCRVIREIEEIDVGPMCAAPSIV